MVLTVISSLTLATENLTSGDDVIVTSAGEFATSGSAIDFATGGGGGANSTLAIHGAVTAVTSASSGAIEFDGMGLKTMIGATGGIYGVGGIGIDFNGSSAFELDNAGTIQAGEEAIQLTSNSASSARITNLGSISGNVGIDFNSFLGSLHLVNAGTIASQVNSVQGSFNSGDLRVENSGQIVAQGFSYALSQNVSSLSVHNTGEIIGRIQFGTENGNLLDNSGRMVGDMDVKGGLTINNIGSIRGKINFEAGSTVFNSGDILGDVSIGEQTAFVINSGTMGGILGIGGGGLTLENTGLVRFVLVQPGEGSQLNITNSGEISLTVFGGDGGDSVMNAGRIGSVSATNNPTFPYDVMLNGGADTFVHRGDGMVHGVVDGGDGNDRLIGAENVDIFLGGNNSDTLKGYGGDDELTGQDGNDDISGGTGDDILSGEKGNDILGGGTGDDILLGGEKNDLLSGGRGDDFLEGGANKDTLNGGRGDDTLIGGTGQDVFIFGRNVGLDTIEDFQLGVDQIDLSKFGLTGFADLTGSGALSDVGGAVRLDITVLGGAGQVFVEDVTVSSFAATDFIF